MNALTLLRIVYAGVIAILSVLTALHPADGTPMRIVGAVEAVAAIAFLIAPYRLAGFALIGCYVTAIALHTMAGEFAVRLVADVATVLFLLYPTYSMRGATLR
ncbi:hypothetical protein [Roseiterribacter gracilis]|uniref:DoxX family protein n=1 Tax=Roseiterribacter gracilis TaxID=2812848 RepID=A0A8S8X6P6_9PROT|nr:hypothetical protein TMPK1_12050 [Rhodospirillales bacterium TMPK1]